MSSASGRPASLRWSGDPLAAAPLTVALLAAPLAAAAAPAQAAPSVSAAPKPIAFGEILTITGKGWPVIEVLQPDGPPVAQEPAERVPDRHRPHAPRRAHPAPLDPRRSEVGAGQWRLVARMRCESGNDGSPIIQRASTRLRIVR